MYYTHTKDKQYADDVLTYNMLVYNYKQYSSMVISRYYM